MASTTQFVTRADGGGVHQQRTGDAAVEHQRAARGIAARSTARRDPPACRRASAPCRAPACSPAVRCRPRRCRASSAPAISRPLRNTCAGAPPGCVRAAISMSPRSVARARDRRPGADRHAPVAAMIQSWLPGWHDHRVARRSASMSATMKSASTIRPTLPAGCALNAAIAASSVSGTPKMSVAPAPTTCDQVTSAGIERQVRRAVVRSAAEIGREAVIVVEASPRRAPAGRRRRRCARAPGRSPPCPRAPAAQPPAMSERLQTQISSEPERRAVHMHDDAVRGAVERARLVRMGKRATEVVVELAPADRLRHVGARGQTLERRARRRPR